MGKWNTGERKWTKPPSSPPLPPATELYRGLSTSQSSLPGRAGSDETVWRIQKTKPDTACRGAGRSQNGAIINPIRNPNTRRNINRRRERNAKQTPNAGSNTNTGGSRNPGRNSNCYVRFCIIGLGSNPGSGLCFHSRLWVVLSLVPRTWSSSRLCFANLGLTF